MIFCFLGIWGVVLNFRTQKKIGLMQEALKSAMVGNVQLCINANENKFDLNLTSKLSESWVNEVWNQRSNLGLVDKSWENLFDYAKRNGLLNVR